MSKTEIKSLELRLKNQAFLERIKNSLFTAEDGTVNEDYFKLIQLLEAWKKDPSQDPDEIPTLTLSLSYIKGTDGNEVVGYLAEIEQMINGKMIDICFYEQVKDNMNDVLQEDTYCYVEGSKFYVHIEKVLESPYRVIPLLGDALIPKPRADINDELSLQGKELSEKPILLEDILDTETERFRLLQDFFRYDGSTELLQVKDDKKLTVKSSIREINKMPGLRRKFWYDVLGGGAEGLLEGTLIHLAFEQAAIMSPLLTGVIGFTNTMSPKAVKLMTTQFWGRLVDQAYGTLPMLQGIERVREELSMVHATALLCMHPDIIQGALPAYILAYVFMRGAGDAKDAGSETTNIEILRNYLQDYPDLLADMWELRGRMTQVEGFAHLLTAIGGFAFVLAVPQYTLPVSIIAWGAYIVGKTGWTFHKDIPEASILINTDDFYDENNVVEMDNNAAFTFYRLNNGIEGFEPKTGHIRKEKKSYIQAKQDYDWGFTLEYDSDIKEIGSLLNCLRKKKRQRFVLDNIVMDTRSDRGFGYEVIEEDGVKKLLFGTDLFRYKYRTKDRILPQLDPLPDEPVKEAARYLPYTNF